MKDPLDLPVPAVLEFKAVQFGAQQTVNVTCFQCIELSFFSYTVSIQVSVQGHTLLPPSSKNLL